MARVISRIFGLDEVTPLPPPPPPTQPPTWLVQLRRVPFAVWPGLLSLLLLRLSLPFCVFAVVVVVVLRALRGLTVPTADDHRLPPRQRLWGRVHPQLMLDEPGWLGLEGEQRVLQALAHLSDDSVVLHDVHVRLHETVTQLDVVVVSTAGIYVLEVKAWTGRVYGKESDRHWTQVKLYGNEVIRERRENPVQQNAHHCRALGAFLAQRGISVPIQSIVVFTEAELATETDTAVVSLANLPMALNASAHPGALTSLEVTQTAALLRSLLPDPAHRPVIPGESGGLTETGVPLQDLRPPQPSGVSASRAFRRSKPIGHRFLLRLASGVLRAALAVVAVVFIHHMLIAAIGSFGAVGHALGGRGGQTSGAAFPVSALTPLAVVLGIVAALRALTPPRRRRR